MNNYEFESHDIDISHIINNDEVCWQYTKDPPLNEDNWHETGSNLYYRLSPVTEALAVASDYVHISKLVPSNIMEWYYRLEALFDSETGFLFIETGEGEVPIRITLSDLKDHIGLRARITNWDDTKFDRYIRQIRMQNHLRELL